MKVQVSEIQKILKILVKIGLKQAKKRKSVYDDFRFTAKLRTVRFEAKIEFRWLLCQLPCSILTIFAYICLVRFGPGYCGTALSVIRNDWHCLYILFAFLAQAVNQNCFAFVFPPIECKYFTVVSQNNQKQSRDICEKLTRKLIT